MRLSKEQAVRLLLLAFCAIGVLRGAAAQSTDQNFPTAVTTNEINGTIKVRDMGDSRLTSYFYAFDGGQGDIFINVVAKNFSGDIDVFTADSLQPLTKMVIYAESGVTETGRLVYMRRGERLILRVEGRSPNDDPATFRIKFGGSFIALADQKGAEAPTIARSGENSQAGTRVNSVGTIIPAQPKPPVEKKPKEPAKETVGVTSEKERETKTAGTGEKGTEINKEDEPEKKEPPVKPKAEPPPKKKPKETKAETVFENKTAKVTVEPTAKPVEKRPAKPKSAAKTATPESKAATPPPATAEQKPADPLASIWLVVELKDGNVIRRPMSEVTKFSVDSGVLVVVAKNGKIVRYSILDVAKVTIE